ncbi:hypothetical protein FG386_001512 [Cryptosporidium ryanae]|uniref:uncharacterized protein n=1 Tax=Cryptosporidium ryanae TaxID=515981 RepID=UPI00351A9554|nr:hypothetical protein FG386_001512 [Cryptosporidium ryanae]
MKYSDEELYISDEDDEINRIGNVPLHWYDEFDHQGYTIDGEKLKKYLNKSDSELQNLLTSTDPDAWRTIYDQKNQTTVRLTDEDLDIIRRVSSQKYANPEFDAEAFNYESDNIEDKLFPVTNRPIPKRLFIPSKWEAKKITHLVKLIRLKILKPIKKSEPEVYDIWDDSILNTNVDEVTSKGPPHIPAPRMELPTHEHSYNPPEEYLADENEINKLKNELGDDAFLPHKYDSLRKVPAYNKLIKERFDRCLDLYLCPRAIKMRMNVDPESILPPPIDTNNLKPYPTAIRMRYEIENQSNDNITISVSLNGLWLSVGFGNIITIYEVSTSRIVFKFDISELFKDSGFSSMLNNKITVLSFHPYLPILSCGYDEYLLIFVLKLPNMIILNEYELSTNDESETDNFNNSERKYNNDPQNDYEHSCNLFTDVNIFDGKLNEVTLLSWNQIKIDYSKHNSIFKTVNNLVLIKHQSTIKSLSWHNKGGYLAVVSPRSISPSQRVIIHSINRCSSITAFKKLNGMVKSVQFHNVNPWLVVATQKCVRIIDLTSSKTGNSKLGNQNTNKKLVKKLIGFEDPTCISIDSTGKHIFVGQSNGRIAWYDLDLSNTPYRLLRYSDSSIKQIQFHLNKSMLFTSNKNGNINVFYSKMPNDIMSEPTFIPLKLIKEEFSIITSSVWHSKQPWIFSAGINKQGKSSLVLWG